MSDGKKPTVAFWVTVVVVVVLVAYPLSWGPLVWLDSSHLLPAWTQGFFRVYGVPLVWAGERSTAVLRAYEWYTSFWRRGAPPP